MMAWAEGKYHLPGIDIVREHYPTRVGEDPPVVTLEVIIGNHPKAMAQHPHWDQFPTSLEKDGWKLVQDTLGSAIIALFPTKVLIWVFSHFVDGPRKYVPVEVMLPAGSALSFATMLHAGSGLGHIEFAMVRQVPSLDDYIATNPGFWHIRGQCYISRMHKQYRHHPDSGTG